MCGTERVKKEDKTVIKVVWRVKGYGFHVWSHAYKKMINVVIFPYFEKCMSSIWSQKVTGQANSEIEHVTASQLIK